tara:strand:- start:691 stop:1767 length:1077 start_codon:yes stop_codon:yes gene_type:complete
MKKKIIFTTGGTGGHIFPAINLMKHFSEKGHEVLLVTDYRGKDFIKKYSYFKSHVIKAETPTNKNLLKKIISFIIIFYSTIHSIFILRKEKPDLIFGFGGYVSFPLSLASKLMNLPLVIYENNVVLGRANKILSTFSKKILFANKTNINFSKKHDFKSYEVGTILSKNIINYSRINYNKKFSLLVLGGSQGAKIFGEIVPHVIKRIKEEGHYIEVIQQCTKKQIETIKNFYKENNIKSYVFEFDDDILKLISSSNLAITRCGASTTAELSQTLTPFIAVPLPNSIDNHQYLNAKYYKDKGYCFFVDQHDFKTDVLFNLISDSIKNPNKLKIMQENMKKNYNKNVYINIDNQTKEFIQI